MRKQKVNWKYLNDKYIKEQGITLIALVITIIVMLILAGISLNLTIGENGILMQARNAKIAQEDAVFNEKKESILFEAYNMKREGKSDEEIEAYLKQAFSELGERTVVSKVGDEWLIVSDERIVKSKLDGVTENDLVSKENVGTSEEWTVLYDEQGYLTIIGSAKTSGNVIIPQVITYEKADGTEGVGTVKQIGAEGYNVFSYRVGITNVTIPEGVQVIYNNSFYECSGLNQEINFPSTLTAIGDYAFYNCSGLTGNIIEKLENSRITKVGSYAFYGCKGLTGELKLFDNISMGAMTLAGCEKITGDINILLAEGLTEIPDGAFSGMSGLTGTPNIPATVKKIGNDAFNNCRGLTGTLTIPNECEEIGSQAFAYCTNFNYLNWDITESKLRKIGTLAFTSCWKISNSELRFPKTLIALGNDAFKSCPGLNGTVYCPELDEVASISFGYCTRIEKVVISSETQKIGIQAFRGCSALKEVEFGNNVTEIGNYAFESTIIENLNLPSTVKKIGGFAFNNCSELKTLGNSNENDIVNYLSNSNVTSIGDYAFSNCTFLTGMFYNRLITRAGNCTLGASIFANTGVITTINLADGLELLNDGTYKIKNSAYTGATNLTGKIDLSNIKLENGSVATITQIGNNAFSGCIEITEVIMPDTIKTIGDSAFRNCQSLNKIQLSANLEGISNYCFRESGLTSIDLPNTITYIGHYALANSKITDIYIPASVTFIGELGLGTSTLKNITFDENAKINFYNYSLAGTSIISIIFPKGIEKIDKGLLANCYLLTKVQFLGKINSIDLDAFSNCEKLQSIDFKEGTENIKYIGDKVFYNCPSLNLTLKLPSNVSIGKSAFKDVNGNNLSGIKLEFVN